MTDHLDAVAHQAQAVREHTIGRNAAIVAAYRAGASISAIARAAGMTRQGIQPIVRRDTMTSTDRDIRRQVAETLTDPDLCATIDAEGIVREIIATYGLVDIDTIDSSQYWDIVQRHDHATEGQ